MSATVRAQNADAQTLFDDGNRMLAAGKIAAACDAFEASNRIEPRAGTLILLGECREKNHQLASAWSAYQDALARVKDEQKRAYAAERVAALEHQLSTMTIDVTPTDGLTVTRNGKPVDRGLWNLSAPVDGGTYVIDARAAGHRAWTTTVSVPESTGKVDVQVPALAADPAIASHVGVAPAAVESSWTLPRKLSIATAGIAVAGGIAGGVLGVIARDKQRDAEKLCMPGVPCVAGAAAQSAINAAHARALDANIAFGVAGAAAIATVVLWLAGAPEQDHGVAIAPAIAPGSVGLALSGSL